MLISKQPDANNVFDDRAAKAAPSHILAVGGNFCGHPKT